MAKDASLLIEIGTEELPPKALKRLSEAFADNLYDYLCEERLLAPLDAAEDREIYATPRRLAVIYHRVRKRQEDDVLRRTGPYKSAAFDASGKPTPAALGFAKGLGVDLSQLHEEETDKGPRLVHKQKVKGKAVKDLIHGVLENAIKDLPIPKRMRWGSRETEFVRPVHWLVVMHGNQVIRTDMLSASATNTTRGHRFHYPREIKLRSVQSCLTWL